MKKYFYLALVAVFFSACSEQEIVENKVSDYGDIVSVANGAVGVMQNGSPLVTVSASDLDNHINDLALAEGYLGGSLTSQDIVDEGSYGYSYIFKYTLIISETESTCNATSIPVDLVDKDFIPTVQDGGNRYVVTCKGTCCDGCTPIARDCSPCGPDSDMPTCEKTITQ